MSNLVEERNHRKQALCIASVASNLDNFNRRNVDILMELGYEVTLAANFFSDEDVNSRAKIEAFINEMRSKGVYIVQIDFTRKIGKINQQLKSVLQVKRLLQRKYDLIHCHSPICAAITRIVANKYRKQKNAKVIYTAHGFHFYNGASLLNWAVYYPVERLLSSYTDVLITINEEDYQRARKYFNAQEIKHVPGIGIDLHSFMSDNHEGEIVRSKLHIDSDEIMLLSVGELSIRKNHEIVIQALSQIKNEKIKYYIAGIGELEEYLQQKIKDLNLEKNVFLLGYRTDISELCKAADVYVFPSRQEGLPVALMEAIACKVPVIATNIRGNRDLIRDSSYLFDPCNEKSLIKCMELHLDHKSREEIKESMKDYADKNYQLLLGFSKETVDEIMMSIYKNI